MAREIGGLSLKFVSPGHTGVPDRVLLIGGKAFFAELKTTGVRGKNWARQVYVHTWEFKPAGFPVHIIEDWPGLYKFFDHVKRQISEI